MVQILKDSIRDKISEAALTLFAREGFLPATMGSIAAEAGVATGTIYKYFKNKNDLFQSIISAEFVKEFSWLTQTRIASFARDEETMPDRSGSSITPGGLLRFLIQNRRRVAILLSKADGTAYAPFAEEYVEAMKSQALHQARVEFPGLNETKTFLFMAHRIFENSVHDTVSILSTFEDEGEISQAFSAMSASQVAGLRALAAWSARKDEQ